MAFSSFCGLLTLQVGAVILSTVFLVVSVLVLGVNAFGYNQGEHITWPINLVLVILFVILMAITGMIIFLASYNESRTLCITAVIFIVITLVFWIIVTLFSLANSTRDRRRICIGQHCPESFWLASLNYTWPVEEEPENSTTNAPSPSGGATDPYATPLTTPKPGSRRRRLAGEYKVQPVSSDNFTTSYAFKVENEIKKFKNILDKNLATAQFYKNILLEPYVEKIAEHKNNTNTKGIKEDDTGEYRFGLPLVGALVFLVANFVFLVFAILVMWSYAQELRWNECCYTPSPISC